jgi:two-component system sensor histidine kinase ChiS
MKPGNLLISTLTHNLAQTRLKTRGLPYLAAFLAIVSVLLVVGVLDREETQRFQQNTRSTVLNQLSTLRSRLEGELNQRLFLEKGLVAYISALNSEITQTEFENFSQVLVSQQSGIRSIALYKNNTVSHMFPLKGNESAIGFSPMSIPEEKTAMLRAINSRQTVIAGPINLVPEGVAFISRTPVFLTPPGQPAQSGSYWGMVGIIVDRDALFRDAGLFDPKLGLRYALRGKDGLGATGSIFYGDAGVFQNNPVTLSVTLPNGSWQIAAVPTAGWPTRAPISQVLWLGGSLLAIFAGILAYILVRWPTKLQEAVDRATLALRKSESELKAANAELKHLDQLKDEFLANTSHELRTPLNGMIGLAESLIDGAAGPLSEPQKYNLQLIVQSGCRLASLINDILDFSRLKHKTIELQQCR